MTDARRDQNRVTTAVGVSDADGATILPVQMDSVTGRMLVEFSPVSDEAGTVGTKVPRDHNDVPCACGVSDTDGTTVVPIAFDRRNGYPFIDVVVE